ncbi:MAG: mandelate racemase/muconate lactonizing enzyme family protein [Inquilinaceae bacterium]
MKITDVRTILVDGGRMNWVIVKIETDAGIDGIGDATVERRETAVASVVENLKAYLLGRDPFAAEAHAEAMTRDSYWRTGVINRSAISGVEAALLDIKGKALNVPVYELLGGRCRDRVRCYANQWAFGAEGPDALARNLEAPLKRGFTAVKWDPFGQAYLHMSRADRRAAMAQIAAARKEGGPDLDLLIEGHGRLDVPTAIIMGRAMAEYEPLFFEEPIPPDSVDAMADVRAAIPVPVAAGERYMDKYRFLELVRRSGADVLQPDACHVGGLFEMKKIAAIGQAAHLAFAPHNPMGPVGNAMTLHLAASTANFTLLETMMVDVPWRADVVPEDLVLEDGHMIIPDRPGLGVTLDEAAAARHPYVFKPPAHFIKRTYRDDMVPWYRVAGA